MGSCDSKRKKERCILKRMLKYLEPYLQLQVAKTQTQCIGFKKVTCKYVSKIINSYCVYFFMLLFRWCYYEIFVSGFEISTILNFSDSKIIFSNCGNISTFFFEVKFAKKRLRTKKMYPRVQMSQVHKPHLTLEREKKQKSRAAFRLINQHFNTIFKSIYLII
jgi:hypothetical protein